MPGPDSPDAPPPEVPEEFADAYRAAYREALDAEPEPARLEQAGGHRASPPSRWRLPVLVAVGALVLILAAYLLGRVLSGDDDDAGTPAPGASAPATPRSVEPSPTPSRSPTPDDASGDQAWDGEVEPVDVRAITAECTSKPSVDSAGQRVSYRARNAVDGDPTTAWRCDGDASGRTLTLRLPRDTEVGEVGLIPGYAKTDPSSGVDRYAENNRITRVTWTFEGSGESAVIEQRLDGSPGTRDLQSIRIPRTAADRVVLRIEEVVRGARNTTAISEIGISAVDD